MGLTAGAGTRCLSLSSSSPNLCSGIIVSPAGKPLTVKGVFSSLGTGFLLSVFRACAQERRHGEDTKHLISLAGPLFFVSREPAGACGRFPVSGQITFQTETRHKGQRQVIFPMYGLANLVVRRCVSDRSVQADKPSLLTYWKEQSFLYRSSALVSAGNRRTNSLSGLQVPPITKNDSWALRIHSQALKKGKN